MERTYLFFDIECANCFGGVGKICSFGYALADAGLNIIESDDIVMNPECEFDWYLFANKDDIKLSYPQEYFRAQPVFPAFYERIRSLLCAEGRTVVAFSALNDVGFVVSACERYNLPRFDFAAYDSEKFVKREGEIFGSLEARCKILGVDNSDLAAHKSSDDAVMTLRLVRAFCQKEGITIEEILQKNVQFCYSVEQFLKKREERARKKERRERQERERAAKRGGAGTARSARGNPGGGRRGGARGTGTATQQEQRRHDSRTIHFD